MFKPNPDHFLSHPGLTVAVLTVFTILSLCAPANPVEAQRDDAVINVPAVVMLVDCPDLSSQTAVVLFGYYQLDGTTNVLEATVENERLTIISDIPAIVFEQLSIDWQDSEALYRFIREDGAYYDLLIEPDEWFRDKQSGVIYQGVGC